MRYFWFLLALSKVPGCKQQAGVGIPHHYWADEKPGMFTLKLEAGVEGGMVRVCVGV